MKSIKDFYKDGKLSTRAYRAAFHGVYEICFWNSIGDLHEWGSIDDPSEEIEKLTPKDVLDLYHETSGYCKYWRGMGSKSLEELKKCA